MADKLQFYLFLGMSLNLPFILVLGILLDIVLWIENYLLEVLDWIQGVTDPCL